MESMNDRIPRRRRGPVESLNDRLGEMTLVPPPDGGGRNGGEDGGPPSNRAACRHRLCRDAPPHAWADCRRNRRGRNFKQGGPNDCGRGGRGGRGRGGRGGKNHSIDRGNHGGGRGSVNGSKTDNDDVVIIIDSDSSDSSVSGNGTMAKRNHLDVQRGSGYEGKENTTLKNNGSTRGGANEPRRGSEKNNAHKPRSEGDRAGRAGGGRRPASSGSASGRMPDAKSPPRVHELRLIEGLPAAHANDLRAACVGNDSMLRTMLDKMGFRGTLEGDGRDGDNGYNVVAEKSPAPAGNCSLVFKSARELSRNQKFKLRGSFAKHDAAGFLEWLGGARGWRFDAGDEAKSWKRKFVIQLNALQGVFTLFAPDAQKYFFVEEKKRMVWRKHSELTEIVSDVRVWIEILPSSELTRRLLRNSGSGPDSPVHWAHHHPATTYPLTVVTESTMLELVEGVIELFRREFRRSASDPLGTRWRAHEKRRLTDWNGEAAKVCPGWTEDRLERLLNRPPGPARGAGGRNAQA